jgi:endonuclease IV
MLGLKPFAAFLAEPRFEKALGILETPEPENYHASLKKLRALRARRSRPSP